LRLNFGIFALHLVLTALFLVFPSLLQDRLGLPSSSHWWLYLSVMLTSFVAMVPFIIVGEKKRKMKSVLCGAVALLALSCTALTGVGESLLAGWFVLFFFFMIVFCKLTTHLHRAKSRDRAKRDRCPPLSSVKDSFHTSPNATFTSKPAIWQGGRVRVCVCVDVRVGASKKAIGF
jgi:hypothetical protein